jgi:hypothetical protein
MPALKCVMGRVYMLLRDHLAIGFCRYSWMPLGCVSSWVGGLDVGHGVHLVSWVLWVFSRMPLGCVLSWVGGLDVGHEFIL